MTTYHITRKNDKETLFRSMGTKKSRRNYTITGFLWQKNQKASAQQTDSMTALAPKKWVVPSIQWFIDYLNVHTREKKFGPV